MIVTEEMVEMAKKQSHTNPVSSIHIRVYEFEDQIPEQELAAKAIVEVEDEYELALIDMFNHFDNREQGFTHDEQLAQLWVEAESKILAIAYPSGVPESAFVTGFPA